MQIDASRVFSCLRTAGVLLHLGVGCSWTRLDDNQLLAASFCAFLPVVKWFIRFLAAAPVVWLSGEGTASRQSRYGSEEFTERFKFQYFRLHPVCTTIFTYCIGIYRFCLPDTQGLIGFATLGPEEKRRCKGRLKSRMPQQQRVYLCKVMFDDGSRV